MKRNPEDLKRLFALRKRRNWTWKELARRSHVPLSTLLVWNRRLRDPAGVGQVRFSRVEVVDPTPPTIAALEVVLKNGTRIMVEPGFDPEHLRRVVMALDGVC